MSRTFTIGVRRAEQGDAEAITQVHDASWRYAYDGVIPAKELARIVARRGPRWWDRAIKRGTAILVIEVGGKICGYATFGPNRARHPAVPRRPPRARPLRLRQRGGVGARGQRRRLPFLPQCRRPQGGACQ